MALGCLKALGSQATMNEEIGFDFGRRCRENHPIYFLSENSRHYHRRSPLFLGNPPSRKRGYTPANSSARRRVKRRSIIHSCRKVPSSGKHCGQMTCDHARWLRQSKYVPPLTILGGAVADYAANLGDLSPGSSGLPRTFTGAVTEPVS